MSAEPATVTAARIEVEKRRAALIETARELQQRLAPRTLAVEAWEAAKNKGADLAEDAVDAVKARPVAVGGIAAALAMFLAREPIRDAAVKIYDAMTSRNAAKPPRPALNKKTKPAATPVKRRPSATRRTPRKTETVT